MRSPGQKSFQLSACSGQLKEKVTEIRPKIEINQVFRGILQILRAKSEKRKAKS
jgi:hypothetical protein